MTRGFKYFAVALIVAFCACSQDEVDPEPKSAGSDLVVVSVELSEDVEIVVDRAYDLADQLNFGLAFDYLDRAIEVFGEDPDLLECYNDLAVWTKRRDVALDSALRLEKAATRESPWNLLKIAEALLNLGRNEEALEYIVRSVNERSFKRYQVFTGEVYDPVRNEPAFVESIQRAQEGIGIGDPIRDLAVTTIDGEEIPLQSMKGRVVLVDFWATWCAPCIRELPNLKDLRTAHSTEDFEIIGISLDENRQLAIDYVSEKEIDWPTCHLEDGWQSEIVKSYGVNALPSMWLYDRQGILRYYNVRGEALQQAVEDLLGEN